VNLPDEIRAAVVAALADREGHPVAITGVQRVGGGCISPTARLDTAAGPFFLKWGDEGLPAGLLHAEARGLDRLRAAGAVRVPEVVALSDDQGAREWLLMEWLEPGGAKPQSWEQLGRELAEMHGVRGDRFGGDEPNFIGSLPQQNTPMDDWAAFWRELRLEPQLRKAEDAGLASQDDRRRFNALYERLPSLLAPAADDGPSLLHGDLWNGNVHMMADGTPALIDPSVYHGHREVDLAMAALFGGFGAEFRRGYEESWPLAPGWDRRRATYQLYYLLVHVNLFGGSYLTGTRAALQTAGV
jgi:fructosamine-3-kinase